jgi:hypothetical protein
MKQVVVHVKLVLEVPDGDLNITELAQNVESALEGDFARKIWSFANYHDKLITKIEETHVLEPDDA